MFNNKFKFDAAADLAKSILEADTKAKMEALKGDQEKLDKNRNGKLDAQDFKILRGEKKVNEAEADYQSSYRVGKTANFKPKVSDVGQGRKITGKMGKYGKQPDDDNMVEPPPEHKVGDVKTDPSAVVPGHSTMGAKLHLASLPKDAEGNTIHKGARRVNAADLVAKRKAMMSGQKNEEVESLDEISIKTKMGAYASTQDPDADQGYGDKVHDQGDRIRASIAKKHGETMAKHADAHASASHYGRKDASGKYKTHAILARDKLSKDSSSPQRITKSGKLHAQDVKTLKNTIRSRNEEVEELGEEDFSPKQTKMAHTIGKEFAKKKVGDQYKGGPYAVASAMVKNKPEAAQKAYNTIKSKMKESADADLLYKVYSNLSRQFSVA